MDIKLLAVVVAAVVNMVVGYAWYSKALFANAWAREIGKKVEDMTGGGSGYALALVGALVQAYILAYFVNLADATTFGAGLMVGLWAWLGFVATTYATSYIFESKSSKLYAINVGYFLVVLLINGGLLAAWR